jgi:hypothetical protein
MKRGKLRVYVAGPLTGADPSPVSYIVNCHKMIAAAVAIHRLGAAPFIPALDFLTGLVAGDFRLGDYQSDSSAWLHAAHVVYRIPGESKGSDAEERLAEAMNRIAQLVEEWDGVI